MDFEEQKKIDDKNEKVGKLFGQLRKVNYYYQIVDEEKKGILLENSKFIINQLSEFGYDEDFLVSLIIGGKDFVESCIENNIDLGFYGNCLVIFG